MRPQIKKVEAPEKYKLFIQFDDGTEGILELSNWAGRGVFKAWDMGEHFFQVFINPESGAITWPGEIDIDTYNAYCKIKGISPENYFNPKKVYAAN